MNEKNNIIRTDNPLTQVQKARLAVLLDVIIPADEDRGMPSAAELDLVAYIDQWAPEFLPDLIRGLDKFDEHFSTLSGSDRYTVVKDFSATEAELFNNLLFHTFACYYQNGRVLEGLGLGKGPPFPGGNTLEPGDLTLLDPVIQRPRLYR